MLRYATAVGLGLSAAVPVAAQEVNLYSARHYDVDLELYDRFTEATGITVNVIEGESDELVARIKTEGANSPADILLTVDAGRLQRAVDEGLFQPIESAVIEQRVPENFQHPENLWIGLSSRARVIFYNTENGPPEGLTRMEDLADPRFAGEICIRSSSNIYNISLLSELIAVHGEEEAEAWARGLSDNLARAPEGGDRDQIRAVAAGECDLAVANTYYWGGLAASANPEDRAVAEQTAFIYPNQDDRGAHLNVSGAGLLVNSPNEENAIRFLEYLVSDEAQQVFADGNNEFPVVPSVQPTGPISEFTNFKISTTNVAAYGENAALATEIFDRVGMP
jgi:iron(III) transport system substrate-binding protein